METREGFSIREYVSRMRSVDVVKCWPFDEATSEESVKSLLPPITVKKFIWWLDGLDNLHSESSKIVDNSKKKKKFQEKGKSSVGSKDDVEESYIDVGEGLEVVKVKSSSRGKTKAPKKRSILEIFAVAPPVERVISDDDEEDNSVQEEDNLCNSSKLSFNEQINEEKKKKKKTKNKEIKVTKKIKMKKKKGDNKIDLSVPKKADFYTMFKQQDQDNAIENRNSSDDHVAILKKRPRLQHGDADKKNNAADNAFRLFAKSRHQGNTAHGILKKASCLEQSKKCPLQETVQVNHFGIHEADKHVQFLQKDNIRRKPSLPHCVGKDSAIVETNGAEHVSNRIANEVDERTFMKQHNKEATSISRFVTSSSTVDDKNKCLFDACLGVASLHVPEYACPPVSSCLSHELYYNSQNSKMIANSSSSTSGTLNGNFETPGPRFPPACLMDSLKTTYNEPWYGAGNICGETGISGINEDLVGLPLNSQGEFITLSSRANGDFINQTIKSSIIGASSISLSLPDKNNLSKCFSKHSARASWDCRTSSRQQLNLLRVEDEKNPAVFVPSRLDITESQGNGQKNLDLDLIKISNDSLHSENSLCDEYHWFQKSHANEKIQSKMRLMGKEFIVGGMGVQEFGNEHIWKDNQIIDELPFSNTSMHDQNKPSLRETIFFPPETYNHRSKDMYTSPHFDLQTSSMHQNGFVPRKINTSEKLYPGLSPSTSSGLYNGKPLFPEPFPSGCDSHQVFNPEPSTLQLKNNQNMPRAPRSNIRFPFELEGHGQSSWSRSPLASCQSPWLLDVSRKGMVVNNFQSYHDLGCSHHHVVPGNNWTPDLSVSTEPGAFCLYNPLSSGSTLPTSICPAASHPTLFARQEPMFCYPGAMPISSVRKQHENQKKIREGIMSTIGIRGLDHGRKFKRPLPSAMSNVAFLPVGLPSLRFDESTTCVNFEGVQNVETVFESCSATKKSKILISDEYRNDQNEERIYPWIDSYSSTARPCPMKLTAGPKHIFKARHQIDQSNSRFSDSSVPLGAMTSDFMFPDSGNLAKTYKF